MIAPIDNDPNGTVQQLAGRVMHTLTSHPDGILFLDLQERHPYIPLHVLVAVCRWMCQNDYSQGVLQGGAVGIMPTKRTQQ